MRLAEQEDDPRLRLEAHVILGPSLAFAGQAGEGLVHLDRAIELFDPEQYRSVPFRLGPNPGVAAASISALLHFVFGDPRTAERRAATALEFAARLGHPYSLAYGTFHVALLDLWQGRFDRARARAEEVVAVASAHQYEIWSAIGHVLGGVATAALGDAPAGLAEARRGVAMYREIPTPPVFWPQLLGLRATAEALAGRLEDAITTLGEALTIAPEDAWDASILRAQRADLLASMGETDEAERQLLAAFEQAAAVGARFVQLLAATGLTRLSPAASAHGRDLLVPLVATYDADVDTRALAAARAAISGGTAHVR